MRERNIAKTRINIIHFYFFYTRHQIFRHFPTRIIREYNRKKRKSIKVLYLLCDNAAHSTTRILKFSYLLQKLSKQKQQAKKMKRRDKKFIYYNKMNWAMVFTSCNLVVFQFIAFCNEIVSNKRLFVLFDYNLTPNQLYFHKIFFPFLQT